MRASKSSFKLLVAVLVLAGLWLGAPRIGKLFSSSSTSQNASSEDKSDHSAAQTTQVDQHPKRVQIDPATLPAGTVWTLRDGQTEHTYAIALDELYVPSDPKDQHVHRLPIQPNLTSLLSVARTLASSSGVRPELVLYPLSGPRDEFSRRIVTMKVHIQTDDLAAVQSAASSLGLSAWETPRYAPGHAIADVSSADPSEPLRIAATLAKLPHVSSAVPLLARQMSPRTLSTPTDTLFAQQWHLQNTGQQSGTVGIDINVTPIWPSLDGTGITIGIVDNGVQLDHPDLDANTSKIDNYDWNGNGITQDTDPSPDVTKDFHGTSVAGLAAARDNGSGVVGVAPRATLYGLRLIALPETDQDEGEAMDWKNDVIFIKNNSWGPADGYPEILGDAGSLWSTGVAKGTATGRGGLGTIYVFAAGNGKDDGDQGNKDAYANNINVIAVSALTNKGTSTYYSEGGAHIIVSAPGGEFTPAAGITTTDLAGNNGYNTSSTSGDLSDKNYTKTFDGTSAAAPIVSGVVALMLEANPSLGWRDVQEILLRSSTQIQPTDADWVTRDGGQPSLPLIKQHSYYGGGLINAQAATDLAKTWTPLGSEAASPPSATNSTSHTIPDAGPAITIPLDLGSGSVVRVEHVELTVNITHPYRGDLEIKLISPSGVVSTLATPTYSDSGTNYPAWTFTSVRHWGESSAGTWKLSIRDAYSGYVGKFLSATLTAHGVTIPPPTVTLQPQDAAAAQGDTVTLTCAGTGSGTLSYRWRKDGAVVPGATAATLSLSAITLAEAGTYTCDIANFGASVTTHAAKVVVYNPNGQSQIVNPGATFTTPQIAAGPIDSYQWSLNGSPLSNSAHVTGVTTASLTINNISSADNGSYTLAAMFNGNPLNTGAIAFAMRMPPVVSAPGSFHSRIGSTVTFPLTTDNAPYLYRYIGLPKGLAYDINTAAVSGRSTVPGTFPVILIASDSVGLVTIVYINLVVDPLPAAVVGVFNGIVDRDPVLNQNLGGSLSFTTTAGGLLTGKLTQGSTAYPFTGSLDGAPGADATATLTIPRKGLSALTLHLNLPLDDSGVIGTLNSTVAVTAWRKATTAPAYAGNYTFALETPAGMGWPAGYSTGTLAVSTAGAVTWTLQPADGTSALKGTTTLSADGTLPLFAPIKIPSGSFLGFFSLPVNSSPASSLSGSVTWLRDATSSPAYANSAGFGPLVMTLHGGLYAAPPADSLILGLPVSANNAMLEFGGTDIDLGAQASGLSAFTLTLASQNKAVVSKTPTALKFSVNATTGAFSGTFTLTDPSPSKLGATVKRSEKFSGVLLLQDDLGAGFFVLPAIPGSANGTTSGSVIFSQSAP